MSDVDFDDEPIDEPTDEPTEEELAEARALAEAIDGSRHARAGSLVDLALAIRATEGDAAPLDPRVIERGVEEGLARRRQRRVRLAVGSALAAAAILLGALGLDALRGATQLAGLPPLSSPAATPLDEAEPASARVDRMARLATHDLFAGELARRGGRP